MDNVKQLRAICDELLLTDKEAALALDGIIELIECKRRSEDGGTRFIVSGGEVLELDGHNSDGSIPF